MQFGSGTCILYVIVINLNVCDYYSIGLTYIQNGGPKWVHTLEYVLLQVHMHYNNPLGIPCIESIHGQDLNWFSKH